MKKIYGAFLAILMLGCFVGCNNNPSDDSSSKDDSLLGEITYTKPILPESVGKDPFEGLTELVTDSNEKFLVNTELKTISSCDSEGNISTEYEYSYKNTDDGVILSVVISKLGIYEMRCMQPTLHGSFSYSDNVAQDSDNITYGIAL